MNSRHRESRAESRSHRSADVPSARSCRCGNARTSRPRSGAFTLIELILVMAMLAIVLSVVFPSLKNFFHGRNLDSEARRFLSLTRYGQSRAISEGAPTVLWIDAKQRMYGLQIQAGYTDQDGKAVQYSLGENLEMEVPQRRASTLVQSNLWTQTAQQIGPLPAIRFLPDGTIAETSPEQIIFHNDINDATAISQNTNRLNYEIAANIPANLAR